VVVIDGSSKNVNEIKSSYYYWKYDLKAVDQFITRENINTIVKKYIPCKSIGLLSVDIDGNDYWILNEIELEADILVCEFNPWFGFKKAITIPYIENFVRSNYTNSYSYYGASFKAIKNLAEEKGYLYVGMSIGGQNAFFINKKHKSLVGEIDLPKFNEAKFRNPLNGIMIDKEMARKEWKTLNIKVFDIDKGQEVLLKDIIEELD